MVLSKSGVQSGEVGERPYSEVSPYSSQKDSIVEDVPSETIESVGGRSIRGSRTCQER